MKKGEYPGTEAIQLKGFVKAHQWLILRRSVPLVLHPFSTRLGLRGMGFAWPDCWRVVPDCSESGAWPGLRS